MVEILHSISAFFVVLILWFAYGAFVMRLTKTVSFSLCLLFGCLLFYAVSEIIILPFILFLQPFTNAYYVWLPITLGLCLISFIINRKLCYDMVKQALTVVKKLSPLGYVAIGFFVLQLILIESTWMSATDDTYYTGVISTTLHTDTMFQVDSFTGDPLIMLDIRYALSLYPIVSAMLCKLLFIHPLLLMRITFPALVLLLCYLTFYKIAQALFRGRQKFVFLFLIAQAVLIFFSGYSFYTAQFFLLMRTAQGKAIFGNVLLAVLFLLLLYLYQNTQDNKAWVYLFLLSFSSFVFSLTSAFLMPVAMGAYFVPLAIFKKDISIFGKFLLCSAPPILVVAVYYLFQQRIFYLPI